MTASTQEHLAKNTEDHSVPLPADSPSKKGGFFSYILLPGFIPQIQELSRGGFGYLALLIATVYQAVRILPAGHPYTQYSNLGNFGIRHVIAAAANNVQVNKKNLDQMIIFFAVLAGIVILALQLLGFLFLIFSGQAWAQGATTPDSFGGIFNTPFPDKDIAFHMLREVFGIPNMFGNLNADAAAGAGGDGRTAFHQALQGLFQFYNFAILIVAILVFVYYIIVVVAETAQTGTPFGQRFSHIYAPFRLVIAIGLLVPLNYGFNGAQYLTLYAAKLGSGFATTGWSQFNDSITQKNPLGEENASLLSDTESPDIGGLAEFMGIVTTCKAAYKANDPEKPVQGKILFKKPDGTIEYISLDEGAYTALSAANNTRDINIIFGQNTRTDENGKWRATCGQVTIPINVPMSLTLEAAVDDNGELNAELGDGEPQSGDPAFMQFRYLQFLINQWENSQYEALAEAFVELYDTDSSTSSSEMIKSEERESIVSDARAIIDDSVRTHYEDAQSRADFQIRTQTLERGWGGAGIWYNRIAQINGAYVVTTLSPPEGKKYPQVMEDVHSQKKASDGSYKKCKAYEPNLANNTPVKFGDPIDKKYAQIFSNAYEYWSCEEEKRASNFFLDSASAIFGLNGLINIRGELDAEGNPVGAQIHPLAKLSALGRGLVESAIRNMALAITSSTLGGVLGVLEPNLGQAAAAASGMFVSIATIGLSIGFITYYVLPFLPFMYFFFAVGSWVKSIFEAMVGAPLWALAHLRIDGDGLPGQMAMNGYVLILEIFLRPILTVFGLLGGLAIFSALATVLNEIFTLVVDNTANVDLTRDDARGIIDVFFFTVVYAVILYMMALASFKMINLVPNFILRWLGQNVSTFSDNTADPTDGLIKYAAIGGAQIGGQIGGGLTKLGQAGGQTVGGIFGLASAGNQQQQGGNT